MKVVLSERIWFELDEGGWTLVIKKKDAEERILLDDREAFYLLFFGHALASAAQFVALQQYLENLR